MKLSNLSFKEREIVYECMKAAADGPFFPDWEFETLFGLDRNELKSIVNSWPNIDESDETVLLAINNSMANLIGYPHGKECEWKNHISGTPKEISTILEQLQNRGCTEII